ncbi:unnamed protein product [Haemonchus placei]|uniref:Secreted protein n=1 Tax=Haemonchus placei TaxID=6290 RepID=A0A0N4WA00_HAEPC|nr:unnamed protein product [Haemonchus placei]
MSGGRKSFITFLKTLSLKVLGPLLHFLTKFPWQVKINTVHEAYLQFLQVVSNTCCSLPNALLNWCNVCGVQRISCVLIVCMR